MKIPLKKEQKTSSKMTACLFVVIFLIILIGWLSVTTSQQHPEFITNVTMKAIGEKIQCYGYLRPANEFSIMPTVQGTLTKRLVRPGDLVQKEDLLLEMQNFELQQAYTAAELEVLSATAVEKETISNIAQQHRQLNSQYLIAEAELELSLARLTAHQQLFEQKIVSQIDLQQVEIASKQARLTYQAKAEELTDFTSLKKAKMAVAAAKLAKAQANLALAKNRYASLSVRAPSDGLVQSLNRDLMVGHLIHAGIQLGTLADTKDLFAELSVLANYAVALAVGQLVHLDVKGKTVEGKISHIEPNVVDNQVKIVVELETLPDTARLNIEVNGYIETAKRHSLIIQRPEFIKGTEDFITVERQLPDDTFEELTIKVGLIDEDSIEVLSGLQLNDQVKIKSFN